LYAMALITMCAYLINCHTFNSTGRKQMMPLF
jgi:hypothetical protein